jgi:predicted nucleic acid-binding protein
MPKVLDSFALLAWMQNEASAPAVDALLAAAEAGDVRLFVSIINIGEVYYRLAKAGAGEAADDFRRDVRRRAFPFTVVPANNARVWLAATIKARYAVAYADAFAIAVAQEHRAPIVTGDPEILALRGDIAVEVEPLPR